MDFVWQLDRLKQDLTEKGLLHKWTRHLDHTPPLWYAQFVTQWGTFTLCDPTTAQLQEFLLEIAIHENGRRNPFLTKGILACGAPRADAQRAYGRTTWHHVFPQFNPNMITLEDHLQAIGINTGALL